MPMPVLSVHWLRTSGNLEQARSLRVVDLTAKAQPPVDDPAGVTGEV